MFSSLRDITFFLLSWLIRLPKSCHPDFWCVHDPLVMLRPGTAAEICSSYRELFRVSVEEIITENTWRICSRMSTC